MASDTLHHGRCIEQPPPAAGTSVWARPRADQQLSRPMSLLLIAVLSVGLWLGIFKLATALF